jgi:4-alpha-glucanotransferase
VLLHVTSLPSAYGAGDLGPWAYRFVDFLEASGCTLWQVLPLVPTHPGDGSPYNAISAMAGNPELISLDRLADLGLLTEDELTAAAGGELGRSEVRARAAHRFGAGSDEHAGRRAEFHAWCASQRWLEDYARFVVLRRSLDEAPWSEWPPALRDRDPAAMAAALAPLEDALDLVRVEQWFFARQWAELHRYAVDHGVLVFGDLPIFVSYDSADVWKARDLFLLDHEGQPTTVTGVPPDYFSADGQRWNNPHYDWDAMAEDGFAWWRGRVSCSTWSASTTSAASRRPGTCRRTPRPPRRASGWTPPAATCSRRWSRPPDPAPSWPRTSARSRPR